jgi:hypothetical protein
MLPDVFRGQNYFDMFAMANRAQRVANKVFLEEDAKLNEGTATDYTGYLRKTMTGTGAHSTYISDSDGSSTLAAFINKVASFSSYFKSDDNNPRMESDPRIDPNSEDPKKEKKADALDDLSNYFDAEFRDGSQFATFKVSYTGPAQEAFGNSVMESEISSKLNSKSSDMRTMRFTTMDGNAAGEAVGAVAGAVKDVAMGALDGLTFGFSNILNVLGGSGYIDIPKHWQSSSATLNRTTYKMQLVSPYGNVFSRIQNLYIPLCMILAGALPLSAGAQAYTSPFLCQIFDRGRQQIKLGMIESVSITRGTTHLAFTRQGAALGIDISFNVVDLSSIMHMPVSSGSLFETDMALSEDNILSDYLAVLSNQDLHSQLYQMPKAKLKVAKTIVGLGKLTSPAYWASFTHDSAVNGALNTLTLGASSAVVGIIEGANRGSDVISNANGRNP